MVWEKLRQQIGVVTGCCLKDKAHIVVDQINDMWAVETESIFDHHAFQMRMILAAFDEKPAGGLSLTILHDNHSRAQGKHGQ
jgi:hypothetical protein